MSTSTSVRDRFASLVELDWYAFVLIVATVAIQLGALRIALVLTSTPGSTAPEQTSNTGTGGYMVGLIVVETVVLVLLWRFSRLFPDWLRAYAKKAGLAAIGVAAVWACVELFGLLGTGAALVAAAIWGYVAVKYDLSWMLHNALALCLGITATAAIGLGFAPRVILVFLALLTVWDMVAVWKTDWMSGLLELSTSLRLPIYFIIPSAARIDMDDVADWVGGDEDRPQGVTGAIGLGDFAAPGALTVSAAVALPGGAQSPAVVGSLLGACVAATVLRGALLDGGTLPALPWLATGSVAGFLVGVGVAGVSLVTVLGGGV